MRRQLIAVMFVLLAAVVLVSAYDQTSTVDTVSAMPGPPSAILRTADGTLKQLTLEPIEEPDGPLTANALPATDSCDLAPTLLMNDGGQNLDIRDFNATPDPSDPILSCMWGVPTDTRGFRTAWYKLVPQEYGIVSLSTFSSNYDTVLAVHRGTCGAYIELACNDDENYFTSRLELEVLAGETYYVEVADWNSAASGQLVLNTSSESLPIDSFWDIASTDLPNSSFRSRHIVVSNGQWLYIIAGQTTVGSSSDRTPTMYVYNTGNQSAFQLANMPGGSDNRGYSNTTAALVDGRIYVPAGFTGGINEDTHLAYEIATNTWSPDWPEAEPKPENNDWANGQPAIYSQANPYAFTGFPGAGYLLSGGMTGTFPTSDASSNWSPRPEVYFYSADFNTWSSMTEMPVGRLGHVAAVQSLGGQDHLCVAGGMGGDPGTDRVALSSTYCLNLDSATSWRQVGSLNYERYFASSAVNSHGNWFVVGGYDDQGNLVGVTERFNPETEQWEILSPGYSVVKARAWSRGAFVDDTFWIVGGETVEEGVLNEIQRAVLPSVFPKGPERTYLPLIGNEENQSGRRNDTMATASRITFSSSIQDRFYTPDDMVNIYRVDIPSPRRAVRFRADPLNSGNWLDIVIYNANKGFVAESRQPFNGVEDLTLVMNPGRYYIAVERAFPLVGNNPSSRPYLLQVLPG